MPWPIPDVAAIARPQPIRIGRWMLVFVAVMGLGAGATLLLWPQGRPTNEVGFWLFLIGLPLTVFALVFGLRLTKWERGQLLAEESEQECRRLDLLWRNWARRDLSVVRAQAFLPIGPAPGELAAAGAHLPVNALRSVGFPWAGEAKADSRYTTVLNLVADRFTDVLAELQSVEVRLVLDDVSLAQEAQEENEARWSTKTKQLLEASAPGVSVDVHVAGAHPTDCVAWMEEGFDVDEMPARLVIAAQIWPDTGERVFSEGAAALLLKPRTASRRDRAAHRCIASAHLLRPMASSSGTIAADVCQLLDMQGKPGVLPRAWLSGCTPQDRAAFLTVLCSSGEDKPAVLPLDDVMGFPGPVSGWIALAIALETAGQDSEGQLVAWHTPGSDRTHLCVAAPSIPGGN